MHPVSENRYDGLRSCWTGSDLIVQSENLTHYITSLHACSYTRTLRNVVESLSGFLNLLCVQCLPQSLLSQMGIKFHPHPDLAVLEQELLLVRPEVNWRWEENKARTSKQGEKSLRAHSARLISNRDSQKRWTYIRVKTNPEVGMKEGWKDSMEMKNKTWNLLEMLFWLYRI